MEELLRRLRARREELVAELNPSGPLQEVAREIAAIVDLERAELARSKEQSARVSEALLDALPDSPSAALSELSHLDFASNEARARFEALVDQLRRQALEASFKGMTSALEALSEQDVQRMKDMLAELNSMLDAHARGEPHDFEGFMSRYGDMFPENPRSLDELLDALARRALAAARLAASLTPQQRAELTRLISDVLDDVDLDWQLSELNATLRALRPEGDWDEPTDGTSWEQTSFARALDAVERIGELEALERQLAGDYPGATLEDVDEAGLRTALGDDAVANLRRLKAIERALEKAGVVKRRGGRLELTARGARLIGERSLSRLLARIGREPSHRAPGGQSEPTGQTRPWVFGDSEAISVQRTVFNAVARGGGSSPLHLEVEDFEVTETECRPRVATALLLDLSYSMPTGGHWVPAKRMALALAALIEGRYPQDELFLIGFSDYAREMSPVELASAGWEHVHGTNMHHAFLLARRRLTEARAAIRQVVMVTDGEPTAHLDPEGTALFNWPPVRETVERTLREAARLARSGISVNVFMLEDSPGLVAFMTRLARLTSGQIVAARSPDLERIVIGDYLRSTRPPEP